MVDPGPEKSKSPAEILRERRHELSAMSGAEHFPSDLRYDIALDALERTLAKSPGKGVLDLMDGLAKLYEYQYLLRNDPAYRHPELLEEIEKSMDAARNNLLSGDAKLTPVDRQLGSIGLSLTLSQEYLRRFHESEVNREKNLGLAQHHVRMAIERAISAFAADKT